jgi:hypothetical protein
MSFQNSSRHDWNAQSQEENNELAMERARGTQIVWRPKKSFSAKAVVA